MAPSRLHVRGDLCIFKVAPAGAPQAGGPGIVEVLPQRSWPSTRLDAPPAWDGPFVLKKMSQ